MHPRATDKRHSIPSAKPTMTFTPGQRDSTLSRTVKIVSKDVTSSMPKVETDSNALNANAIDDSGKPTKATYKSSQSNTTAVLCIVITLIPLLIILGVCYRKKLNKLSRQLQSINVHLLEVDEYNSCQYPESRTSVHNETEQEQLSTSSACASLSLDIDIDAFPMDLLNADSLFTMPIRKIKRV